MERIKKIIISGVHIDSITAMQNEILKQLKIQGVKNDSFTSDLRNFMSISNIEKLNIIWSFFSISLMKMVTKTYGIRNEKFKMNNESNMHFHAFNDTLISEEESKEITKKENIIKENIKDCFSEFENVTFLFEG